MKLDPSVTAFMRENRYFTDKRSKVKRDNEYKLHVFPAGQDMVAVRFTAWAQFTGWGHCEECGVILLSENSEMDHIKNKGGDRCSCLHNLRFLCHACHTKRHGRTIRFTLDKSPE